MNENQWLADQFEQHRPRLRLVAYRILGSNAEADDAVQEAWLRLSRSDEDEIDNLGGWLTTVVGRVCLNMLRSRSFLEDWPDERETTAHEEPHPEEEAMLADSVGLALQVVLDTLSPTERLAFVLHDIFDVPFDEIAPITGRSTVATRQLASRARRRVKVAALTAGPDVARQREIVSAFFAAARLGDFDALVAVLDPGAMLRIDADLPGSTASMVVRGAVAVAGQALNGLASALRSVELQQVFLHGAPGMIVTRHERPVTVISFVLSGDKIIEIDAHTDPDRVDALAAAVSRS